LERERELIREARGVTTIKKTILLVQQITCKRPASEFWDFFTRLGIRRGGIFCFGCARAAIAVPPSRRIG
jgi:hypothetical protein